eukprot:XP_011601093.1 PREDICTED: uncharacterized protein LOC105416302 [Takifugu rubripes]
MKIPFLIFLIRACVQLQCDPQKITAHIGGEFVIFCKYNTNNFLYSKKYWCQGESRLTCEILVDSDFPARSKTGRAYIGDLGRRGLFVKVTGLHLEDTGVYWVGIDKINADIMTQVKVVVTEVPVSKPRLWPLNSLADRPTCWGQPVTVRCQCTEGTAVHYSWYQEGDLLHHLSDLQIHCGIVLQDSHFYCVGMNDVSQQESDIISVQVLKSADNSCIYVIRMPDQPIYDCMDRFSTTGATTSCSTVETTSSTITKLHQTNQTDLDSFFSRTWTGVPFWYRLLRWGLLLFLLIFLWTVIKCT